MRLPSWSARPVLSPVRLARYADAEPQLHATSLVVGGEIVGNLCGQRARHDAWGELDHGDVAVAQHGARGDLHADDPAAEQHDPAAGPQSASQLDGVRECAQVDVRDSAGFDGREAACACARRKDQLVVVDPAAVVELDQVIIGPDRRHASASRELDALRLVPAVGPQPDVGRGAQRDVARQVAGDQRLELIVDEHRLRKRRPVVRQRMLFPDAAGCVPRSLHRARCRRR